MKSTVMIDSGAFSVWSKGITIDLDDYIRFCRSNRGVDFFINLDVIAVGTRGQTGTRKKNVDDACREGWENYQRIIRKVPMEKVLPVFHYGDPVRWLEKCMDFEVPYLAIGGMVGTNIARARNWMRTVVEPIVTDSNGKMRVQMHGLGLMNYRMLSFWPWTSVDSAAWVLGGGLGVVYVPQIRNGEFDYSCNPYQICVSDRPPERHEKLDGFGIDCGNRDTSRGVVGAGAKPHLLNLSPTLRGCVDRYLEENGVKLGSWEVVDVSAGYKLKKGFERWGNKRKTRIIRVLKKGLITDNMRRKWLNMRFIQRFNECLPIDCIYLAGCGVNEVIEAEIRHRLLSFYDILTLKECRRALEIHTGKVVQS